MTGHEQSFEGKVAKIVATACWTSSLLSPLLLYVIASHKLLYPVTLSCSRQIASWLFRPSSSGPGTGCLTARLGTRSDEAMTRCDEGLNASMLQFLCQQQTLHRFIALIFSSN
jgi:hypothetical protein